MSNIKKALVPDLKNKGVADIVALVDSVYKKNDLSTELELQFITLAINASPQLVRAVKANPESLYNSILQAAECGLSLNPQWQEGYFVPYNMKIDGKDVPTVTFSPMYRGKKKLLISKGVVKNITTELVYEGELFDEDIINGVHEIKHKPNSFNRSDPTKIVGGYATITLNNDSIQHVVKGRDYFERCKAASAQKMNGKTSPAWRIWYDGMCEKCLINAADSKIPKIGVNSNTAKLLNDVNTNDVDYVDVTNEDQKMIPEKKIISDNEFTELINSLYDYSIPLDSARQKYKGFDFTDEQILQIKEAGTITPERLDEIIKLVIEDDSFDIEKFDLILSEDQLNEVQQAIIDNAQNK
jgi:recombinational DNA repair protein RecT